MNTVLAICVLLPTLLAAAPLHETLMGKTLEGNWALTSKNQRVFPLPRSGYITSKADSGLSFFSLNASKAEGLFYQFQKDKKTTMWVFVRILDGVYLDGRVVQIQFPLEQGYNTSTNSWNIKDKSCAAKLFSRRQELVTLDFKCSIQISWKPTVKKVHDEVIIRIKSDSIEVQTILSQVTTGTHYFLIMLLIAGLQLACLMFFGRNQRVLFSTSEWLILHACCFFMLQSLFMAKVALSLLDTPVSYLLLSAVINVLVMFLLLSKFEPVVEKFRNPTNFKLAIAFVVGYFMGVLIYGGYPSFWVAEGMIFLWQITHSLRHGGFGGVSLELVVVVLLSRIPLFITLGSADNIQKMTPQKSQAHLLIGITIFHLMIIGLQRKYGGRSFVPKFLIPDFYEYRRGVLNTSEQAMTQCSICLNAMRESPEYVASTEETHKEERKSNNEISLQEIRTGERVQRIYYALTPCGHHYHLKCLGDWLQTKLTCPLCKRGLPPMSSGAK